MAVTVTRTSTLFTDSDGDGVVDPGETLLVHILIQNSNGFDIANLKVYDSQSGLEITDLGTVKITPIALDDYNGAPLTLVGNTPYVISASALLGNDIDPDGPEASLVISSFANASHVTVTDIGGGNLQIVPETGYQGAASFDYFITDAQGLTSVSSGHVNITINGMVWYVDSNASAAGADGSYLHAFTSLGSLNDDGTGAAGTVGPADAIKGDDDVDGANDTIFVYNRGTAYTGGITLEAGQKLYGDGHSLTVNGIAIGDSGANGSSNATINYSSYGVTLSTDNTISGVNLNGTANSSVGLQDGNGSVTTAAGTLNVDTVSISGAGQAVDIDQGGNLNVALTSLSTTGTSAGQGVQLAGTAASGTALISGTFTAAAGSIAGESSHGFQIGGAGPSSGGTIAVSYAGTIGSSSTGSAVNIADRLAAAGTVTFGGNISQTSTASNTTAGIALSNIAGGIINFGGTKTIAVTGGTQNAIQVTGQSGGTIKFQTGAVDIDFAAGTTGHAFSISGQSGGSVNVETPTDIDMAGTASGRGINIGSSTAGSVNFTGGTLTISTRDGAAVFDSNAAGSTHALNISGTGNTLSTTNGGQLVEISNAATSGITLDTAITGASTTSTAVHVNNLDGGTFTTNQITVTGTTGVGSDGIRIEGGSSTNFSLGNVGVSNTSDDGVELNGANGTVTIDNIAIQNTAGQGVEITGATNAVTITSGAIGNINDPTQEAVLVSGGSGNVTVGATVTKTTAGNVVEVASHTGGAVSFSSTISATGLFDNGIRLTDNSGGTIGFTGNVTLTTGGNDALTFTNTQTTGAALSFTGGNLAVTTTGAGKGINATSTTIGAGSIAITGANNTISTANGVALNVDDVRIGSTGLTFKSVNASDPSGYGIFLDNTGTTAGVHGGLTITGDAGTSKTAGGTIGGAVGFGADNAGISISNARDISLDQMTVQNGLDDGIRLSNVVNFSLTQSNIVNNGDALNEHGVDATNVTGTVRFTDDTLTNNEHEQVHYTNDAAGATSADVEFNNVDFTSTGTAAAPNGSHGINLTADGASSVDLRVVNGSDFNNLFSNSIQAQNEGTGTLEVTVANATFTNVGASAINIAQNDSGTVRFNIHDNGTAAAPTFLKGTNNAVSHSININQAGGTPAGAILEGKIDNNYIGNASAVDSASAGGAGIRLFSVGSGTTNIVISNNNIKGVLEGILVSMGEDANAAHTVNATIFNNTVAVTNTLNGFEGIAIVAGTQAGDVGTLRLDMHNNTAGSNSSGGNTDFMVRQRFLTTVELLGIGGANNSTATVQNYLIGKANVPNGANGDWFITENSGGGGGGFDSTASVPQPTLPSPLLLNANPAFPAPQPSAAQSPAAAPAADSTVDQAAVTADPRTAHPGGAIGRGGIRGLEASDGAADSPSPSDSPHAVRAAPAPAAGAATPPAPASSAAPASPPAATSPESTPPGSTPAADASAAAPAVADHGKVTQAELNLLVGAAIDRWAAAGATAEQIATMKTVQVTLNDMMGVQIGQAAPGSIQIDEDGAGYGWFVDSTPGDDSEFASAGTRLKATAAGGASGHVDLLTVLMHELGHQIGLDDSYLTAKVEDLMYGYVDIGERRLPAAGEAALADGHAPAHEAFLLSPVADIGTLPAGKSVDVQFQATVTSYFNQVISPLSNTATAKGDNIADTASNTNVTVVDTMTIGDRVFVDANNNNIFDAGEGRNGVTLTLFADTNNNGVLDIGTDVQLLTTTTAGTGAAIGSYSFANLSAGNYIVRVDASNFTGGGALVGTRGVFGGLDPDNDTDNDDNGIAGPSGSVVASPITLAYGTETVFDGGATPKKDINNSLDFGFVANAAPVANPDSVTATEETQAQYSTELTGNDTDADLDTLTITAVSNFVNGTASVASGIVTFTPTANFNGIASFDYTISDGNGHTATATATVTVGAVNDPVTAAAPTNLALNEDSSNVAVTGLSISDVDAALAPAGVYEVTLSSTHGVLTLTTLTGLTFTGGSDGTADASMTFHGTLADINTALATAKYTPDANYNGSAQISFSATDGFGGTVATGTGTATTDSKNVAVTVNSVNDAPSGTDEQSPVVEGASYTFDATNFTDGFSDPIDGNAFKAVIITTLPTTGTLKLNGVAISAGATITLADLNSHLLTYDAPAGSGNTHPTFTFQVQDNGGIANGGIDTDQTPNTYTFDIAAANAAPVLDLDSDNSSTATGSAFASSYTEGGAAAAIADADVQITDADSGDDIVSATITLTNAVTGDKLNVGGLPAGITIDPSSTDTLVKLVGVAGTSAADFQTALQAVTFSSSSDDPTNHGANLARTVTVVVNDGAADSNVATTTISVSDDNADAPTATSSTITAVEDTFRVIHASDLGFNDVDGTLKSVTIDSVSGGKIYYDADGAGGADPVEQSIPVAFTLQDLDDGKVSFKADANANGNGEGSIHFVVTDDDNNVAASGNTLTVDVTAVNDSPVLTASTPVSATEQTAAYILSGVSVSDVDLDARNGGLGDYAGASFGVNRNPAANAAQDDFDLVAGPNFTIDGINLKTTGGQIFGYINADSNGIISITFTSLETAATSALVDEVIHSITYTNLSDAPPSSVILAAGFSDGSPGGGQGSGATGLDIELVTVNITAVNDAPVNSLGGTIGTGEDASNAWLSGMSISDPDADPANDLIYVTFQVQHGELAIRTDVVGGINSGEIIAQAVDTITVQATLNEINATLAASNGLTYSPALNFNGDDTLTVYTNDAGYTGTDPGLTGDGTSEEDVDTRTISVSAVDDPAVAVNDDVSTNENAVKTGNVFDANPTTPDSDVDGPTLTVSAVSGGTVGTQFALASGALLTVNSDGSYSYDPNGQFNYLVPAGSGAVNTTATDQFTYTLLGGNSAVVTVTIHGVDSVGNVYEGDGTDNVMNSGTGNDTFNVSQGGNDTVAGHDGNDYFYFGDALTAADSVDGGLGTDVVAVLGNYSMTLGADNLVNVERLTLLSGDTLGVAHVTYALTTVDANVTAGQQLTVLGVGLQSDETMVFNGSAETDGSFYIAGGAANDTLVGGQNNDSLVGGLGNDQLYGLAGDDWLLGGAGADTLRGGTGRDSFVYQSTSDSTAASTDHILDFENVSDHIDLSAIDANSSLGGDQAFNFIGQNAFSNTAGELRIAQSGSDWLVMGDTNGDGTADFQVQVSVFNGHIMGASDFVL